MKDVLEKVFEPKILTAAGGLILAGFTIWLLTSNIESRIMEHSEQDFKIKSELNETLRVLTGALQENTSATQSLKEQLYWSKSPNTVATPPTPTPKPRQ